MISGVAHAAGEGDRTTTGRSLAALFGGESAAWRTAGRDRVFSHSAGGQAVAVDDWTLVQPVEQPPQLFAKPDDYFELADVADRSRDVAAALANCLAFPGHQAEGWEKPLPKLLRPDDPSDRYD